jgi:signal transduction histidine kinase
VSAWATAMGWLFAAALGAWGLLLRERFDRVARAEHELRGAATVLCLAVERLRRDPAARRHAEVLGAQLDRLGAGLADLATAGRRRPAPGPREPVQLAAHARSVLAGWLPTLRAAGRGGTLRWEGRVGAGADRSRVAQALGNVIANAVEHGEGTVEIAGRETGEALRVEVRNRTSRDPAGYRERRRAGRGRGLRIAASAAESLGGRLEFRSEEGVAIAALELPTDRVHDPRVA